jgi:hypothetical protein
LPVLVEHVGHKLLDRGMQDTGHHVGEDFAGECSVVRGEPMRDRLEHVLGLKPRSAAS